MYVNIFISIFIQLINNLGRTESTTESVIIKTTPHISNTEIKIEKLHETTIELPTIISTKLVHSRMLLLTNNLIENAPCTFQGNMPDQDNCQCRKKKIFN